MGPEKPGSSGVIASVLSPAPRSICKAVAGFGKSVVLDVTGDTAHLDAARSGVVLDDPIVAVDVTLEDDRR